MKTPESLKHEAVEKTGLSDFGDAHFEPLLEAYAQDLSNPQLSETGRFVLSGLMVSDLARRLQVIDCLKANPEIDDVVIPPILYISGLERTGTTFLHNLLNLNRKSRSLKRWELMHPTPPPETATYRTDARIEKTKASIDKLRGSLLEQMHWVEAEDPEECAWAVIDGFSILGASAVTAMPTFREEIIARNPEQRFQEYRRIVKMLLWKNPPPEGGHLVLKCPQFLAFMPSFLKVFPEAQLILTHRDPFRATTSVFTLQAHIHGPFFQHGSVLKTSILDAVIPHVERRLLMLNEVYADDKNVTHVAYPNLVRDPIETVRSICRGTDMSLPFDINTRLETFINEQKAGRRAKPPRNIPTFGLDQDEFLSRPIIAEYCRLYGVEPERKRQTGA